jgi:hypothetical protein
MNPVFKPFAILLVGTAIVLGVVFVLALPLNFF